MAIQCVPDSTRFNSSGIVQVMVGAPGTDGDGLYVDDGRRRWGKRGTGNR